MTRWKLTLEYDGRPFVGWQRQANGPSVQGVLEEAVHGFCGERVTVHGAGRTDAGVHARGQVAHIDLAKDWSAKTVRDAINAHLRPHPVAVLKAEEAAGDFEARFHAIRRAYRYVFVNRRAPLTFEAGLAWQVAVDLDAAAMHRGAQFLLGRHDFTTFRAAQCQAKSPVRTLDEIAVTREGERIVMDVAARSFLHSQVRAFAGSLKLVGEGRWPPEEIGAALAAADRARCGPVAPPDGLYLMQVDYPA
ncbi:MAG: tRNA pseudouridine(38-40) synthase TruA [Alphaproteobacteria bacterium]|nr:tRNA pseudouridine(38-40) synthase TruA [Alphaproteobacteria bacterium]